MTTLKNRPRDTYKTTKEWFEDFEKELPLKLDGLAAMLAEWLLQTQGFAVSPSSVVIRRIIEKWYKKEILGEKENEG